VTLSFAELLQQARPVLGGGSMYERLRRHPDIECDPHIAHAALIYDDRMRAYVETVHREYIAVSRAAALPMVVTTGSWRASPDRLARSAFAGVAVNEDQVRFVRELCASATEAPTAPPLFVGAVMGARGDAYKPAEGLSTDDAQRYHAVQAGALASAAPDVMMSLTLPAMPEALGIARALAATELPYLLGFVVRPTGRLLDGTLLSEAIARIDDDVARAPLGYTLACVHPTVAEAALDANETGGSSSSLRRVVGIKANTSAKSPEELLALEELEVEAPSVLAEHVERLHRRHPMSWFAGCCGTDTTHMKAIADVCKEMSA
jgi:homocysteine S-methyltransferase